MRTLWLLALQLALLVYSVSAQQVAARQISAVQQIHIAVGRNPGDVVITFLTVGSTVGSLSSVTYAVDGTPSGSWLSVTASAKAYSWNSWNGVVYVAALTGLQPATYTYQCTADGSTFSAVYNFTVHDWALPSDGSWTWGFTADMGSYPASQVVAARMTPLTSVEMWLLGGDLSYSAGYAGAQANQALNDAFWRMIEPYAANIPVMVTSGNHESYDNRYAAYLGRAGNSMPVDSPGMLYYSYDYRNVHFVALDSEGLDQQSAAQAQIDWINADLTAAVARRAAGAIDFIVCFMHYAPYSSVDPTRGHGSDYTLRAVLEPVLRPYEVDLVLTGHDHLYERTHPVYAAVPLATSNPVYTQGVAPIFVCAGTGGANFYAGWTMPQPEWSAQRALFHGYVLATMHANGTMYFAAFNDTGGQVDEFWLTPRVPTTPPATTAAPATESPTSSAPTPTLPPVTDAPTVAPTEVPTTSPSVTSPVPSPTDVPTSEPTAPPVRIGRTAIFALAIVGATFVVLIGIVLPSVICFRLWQGRTSGPAQPQELQAVELISENDEV